MTFKVFSAQDVNFSQPPYGMSVDDLCLLWNRMSACFILNWSWECYHAISVKFCEEMLFSYTIVAKILSCSLSIYFFCAMIGRIKRIEFLYSFFNSHSARKLTDIYILRRETFCVILWIRYAREMSLIFRDTYTEQSVLVACPLNTFIYCVNFAPSISSACNGSCGVVFSDFKVFINKGYRSLLKPRVKWINL